MKRIVIYILLSIILLSALHCFVEVTEYIMENGLETVSTTSTIDEAESLPVSDFALSAAGTSVPPSASLIIKNVSTAFLLASLSVLLLLSYYGSTERKALTSMRSADESRRLLPYHGFV